MQLYWVGDRYVRTQGEAKKLGFGEVTEIPVDKDGLMEFLNQLKRFHHQDMAAVRARVSELENAPPMIDFSKLRPVGASISGGYTPAPGGELGEPPTGGSAVRKPMDACAQLSRIDSPGVDVDGVIEAIAMAKGYALRRYAGAVAVRFEELGKS